MFFESFIVHLLNKYLSAYIENLDVSQLKLRFWGGDAVLENLHIRRDALNGLNLPITIKSGFIEKLILKIPWKNLYGDVFTISLDGLYILTVPSTSMEYNGAKEAETARRYKQAKLQKIEDRLLQELEENDEPAKKDELGEKIAVQMIKNVQVHVKNIHVCYEDEITKPGHPFSLGITLASLDLQTTDENWIPAVVDKSIKDIFKMVSLNCLAVYFNTKPETLLSVTSREEQLRLFKDIIAREDFVPDQVHYIVEPMTMSAKLQLCHQAEKLKIMLDFVVQAVGLSLSNLQFHSLMELAESLERMSLNAPFRRFQPDVPAKGNAKVWWKYAYEGVLEAGIRRKRKMFTWNHISEHRHRVRAYKILFKDKLKQKKPPENLIDSLLLMEDEIDVFNITLARQTAELEMIKTGMVIRNRASARQADESYWFAGWFEGWGKNEDDSDDGEKAKLDIIMDENDKKLLYKAIGYSESKGRNVANFPDVNVEIKFPLFSLQLQDDKNRGGASLLDVSLKRFTAAFKMSPMTKYMSVEMEIKDFQVDGLEQNGVVPHVVMSDFTADANLSASACSLDLLTAKYETNPPGDSCDQNIVINARPLQVIYDAVTIYSLIQFFTPPENIQLQRLRAVAASAYKDIREQTTTGLKRVMVMGRITHISVKIMSSYIVVPKNGQYLEGCEVLVLDLGEILLSRFKDSQVPKMKSNFFGDDDLELEHLHSQSYDKYLVEVNKIQLLLAGTGDDWILNRTLKKSPLHILEPLNVRLFIQKSINSNDESLPRIQISGELLEVSVKISDKKLRNVIKLGASIPLSSPEQEIEDSFAEFHSWRIERDRIKSSDLRTVAVVFTEKCLLESFIKEKSLDSPGTSSLRPGVINIVKKVKKRFQKKRAVRDGKQITYAKAFFLASKFDVIIAQDTSDGERPLLHLYVENLGAVAAVRTWDTTFDAQLGAIRVEYMEGKLPNGDPMYLIDTPTMDEGRKLLAIKTLVANRFAPSFAETYKNTERRLTVKLSVFEVNANSKALLEIKDFARKTIQLSDMTDDTEPTFFRVTEALESVTRFTTSHVNTIGATDDFPDSTQLKKKQRKRSVMNQDIINLKLDAVLENFTLNLSDDNQQIASVSIEGITALLSQDSSCTSVETKLHNLFVTDACPETLHRQIVSAEGTGVFDAEIINFKNATTGDGYQDMENVDTSVKLRLGSMRVVFVRHFFENMVKFGSNFKEAKLKGAGVLARQTRSVMMYIERNTRIRLDVNLAVPKIFAPRTLKSLFVVAADLGNVKVTNYFSTTCSGESGAPAVIDNIGVEVSDIKVSLCQLNEMNEVVSEDQILEPVSMTVRIKRNLTWSWFHNVPNVTVDASMCGVNVIINEVSFGGLLGTIYENLVKLDLKKDEAPSPTVGEKDKISTTARRLDIALSDVYDTFRLDFSVPNVRVEMFLDQHRKQPLAKYVFTDFVVGVRKGSDLSMDLNIHLGDISLCDARQDRQEGITRFVTKKVNSENPTEASEYVLRIVVARKSNFPMDIDTSVGKLRIIICLEFLLQLNKFMANSFPKLDAKTRNLHPVIRSIVKRFVKSKKAELGLSNVATATMHPNEVKPVKKKWRPICFRFHVSQPDIVLVTDINSSDCQALVLSMELTSFVNISGTGRDHEVTASLSSLQLVNCPFFVIQNITSRHKRVLAPCDVNIRAQLSPGTREFNIQVTKVQITTTPIVIHTIAEALDILAADRQSTKDLNAGEIQVEHNIWDTKNVADMQLNWFVEEPAYKSEAIRRPSFLDRVLGRDRKVSEFVKFSVPSITILLECGQGQHTMPLLITELKVNGDIKDWSGNRMAGNFKLGFAVVYFNESLSTWEPFIEPVESNPGKLDSEYELWTVAAKIQQSCLNEIDSRKLGSVSDLPPVMSVTVTSQRLLHMTITNDALKVLNSVGTAFIEAAKSEKKKGWKQDEDIDEGAMSKVSSGVKIWNMLDTPLLVTLGEDLTIVGENDLDNNSDRECTLGNKGFLAADFVHTSSVGIRELLANQERARSSKSSTISVSVPGEPNSATFDVSKTGAVICRLTRKVFVLCIVDSLGGVSSITLQSPLIVKNHLLTALEVLDKDSLICEIAPNISAPLPERFTSGAKFYVKPSSMDVENAEVDWAKICSQDSSHPVKIVDCKTVSAHDVHLKIEVLSKQVGSLDRNCICYEVNIWPVAAFRNFLPFDVEFSISSDGKETAMEVLAAGTGKQILTAKMNSVLKIKLLYLGKTWTGDFTIEEEISEMSAWTFKDKDSDLILCKQIIYSKGCMKITLYSPYWMVNETGFPLDYKTREESIFPHCAENQDFILFSCSSKLFLAKHKIQLRVCGSNFSDRFFINTVGSNGSITCRTKNFDYIIGIHITLASFGLTKIVTFNSYYAIVNKSFYDLEILEVEGNSTPVFLASNSRCLFWPEVKTEQLKIRMKGREHSVSANLQYSKPDNGLLLKVGDTALFVDVSVTESSTTITITNYYAGSSAVMLVNDTADLNIAFGQIKYLPKSILLPSEVKHYVWPNPNGKREISWNVVDVGKEISHEVLHEYDGELKFKLGNQDRVLFYAVFFEGLQRVLLFTENKKFARAVQQALRMERVNLEISVELQGFSCSVTDTKAKREVMYMAITSSGIVWEEKPRKRWAALALKYSSVLEGNYQSPNQTWKSLEVEKYRFDVEKMRVVRPHSAELRRFFSPGIWLQYTVSDHQVMMHAKINRVQVDNQLLAAVFPVVLYPMPITRSVAINSSPKPFVELSLMQHTNKHQTFPHIMYFKVLVQEFCVKLDMGFITALIPVFGVDKVESSPEQDFKRFGDDITSAKKTMNDQSEDLMTNESGTAFFDILHLSPIKVHLSFSLQNTCNSESRQPARVTESTFRALAIFLKSVGLTISDMDDVVFRLGYFERQYQFFNTARFRNVIVKHYAGQAIKQLYVLVFGLDVIGNPYGFVMGIAEGVTDLFYEPFQGMIQGPWEFFEGLALGALSLFGCTVGGAAGALSRVTGVLGKGVASLVMDEEFQKKRQIQRNKPADLEEGLVRGGKDLVMGIVGGITGVVTKPVEGAKKEGTAGFIKGVGKGIIGIVALPASGVIDLASNAFEGIQKLADMSEEVKIMRPARWINEDTGILEPYMLRKAQGRAILQEVEKGYFAKDAKYVEHVPIDKGKKSFLLLTDKMILEAHTGDIFGQWNSAWHFKYQDISEEPRLVHGGVKLGGGWVKSLFGFKSNDRTIFFHDPKCRQHIIYYIEKSWLDAHARRRFSKRKSRDENSDGDQRDNTSTGCCCRKT